MRIGVPTERFTGEHRVALVPASIAPLKKAGLDVIIERGAGDRAGFPDAAYADKGALLGSREDVFASDVVLQVRAGDFGSMRSGQVVIAMADPLGGPEAIRDIASRGVTAFALELIPRITRAQSMDVLSSMATVAGYKAVLLAANTMPRMCPMLMTAAGTVAPAHAFVIGAGVAGLQAIASARRMGARVEAYDVRPAVKEQIQSLGAKFVELPLESAGAEDKGGYAKAQDEAFYQKQRELMAKSVAAADMVITTAAIPGKKSPVLITADAVKGMRPGSVIVDLAAERGGNCELTKADETVVVHGVTILGPTNLAAEVPYHASQMYSKNILTFFTSLLKDGKVTINLDDEVCRDTLVTRDGQVVNERIKALVAPAPVK
jgi:NAD(P) transhydrogenase subunit alpha